MNGWINKSGELIELPCGVTHFEYAASICRTKKYSNGFYKSNAIYDLWKESWFRVVSYQKELYVHNDFEKLNQRQKAELINLCIETGKEKLVHDYGDDEIIIWTIYDQL